MKNTNLQLKALNEINRLLKIGGQVILTGGNNYYYKNDKKASNS